MAQNNRPGSEDDNGLEADDIRLEAPSGGDGQRAGNQPSRQFKVQPKQQDEQRRQQERQNRERGQQEPRDGAIGQRQPGSQRAQGQQGGNDMNRQDR